MHTCFVALANNPPSRAGFGISMAAPSGSRRATLLLQIEGEESSGLADSLCRAPFCP
ncbi:hypothetical protein MPC4_160065 [Methylocella tundrae]|uniref:Uncharacterized protein n=1 Tax=Methylocella tundrae TaxID=227605 RepID=A0A8B6M3S3_METTU|nr:hypothetical protein MPC1_1200003 [Methylocella tundrae]VTZ49415.1 hypothetical protein MPC4_160065 [Methylocella tundrae]